MKFPNIKYPPQKIRRFRMRFPEKFADAVFFSRFPPESLEKSGKPCILLPDEEQTKRGKMNADLPRRYHGLELLELCGSGAYGDVYFARDISGRGLAVKIVSKKKIGDSWERELKGVVNYRRITEDRPELLQIYHVDEDEDSFYYTMEPADSVGDGEYRPDTLARRLQNGPLPDEDLFGILSEIFAGIRLIHQAGFAHRDIKPDNILFVKGRPKLGDIGLMSSLSESMTRLAGTLDFLPPEQRAGGKGESDRISRQKSDLYAFGKVIYCSVTGLSPQDFPSVPPDLPHTMAVKLFLHLAFRLCDSDPVRRIEKVDELAEAFDDIGRKLICGETLRDRISLFRKNTGLFLRAAGRHAADGVKKHYLLVGGMASLLGLTGYYAIRHFLSRTDSETAEIVEQVRKRKNADSERYSFGGGRCSFDVPKGWKVFDRTAFIPRLPPEQIEKFRHTQAMILPDEHGNRICISYIQRTEKELNGVPDSGLATYLQPLFPSGIKIQQVRRNARRRNRPESLIAVGTCGADETVVSYLYPRANRTIAFTLYQREDFPDDRRAEFIAAADSFTVHPDRTPDRTPDPDGRTPLMAAMDERDFAGAERLIEAGADLNGTAYHGCTALQLAVMDGAAESVRFLLAHGADVNRTDGMGMTPLQRAAYGGFADIAGILLAAGADLARRDLSDRTALSHAVAQSQADCVRLLLEAGADPNVIVDGKLKTPLILLAVVQNDPVVLRLLIRHGASLNTLNTSLENALLRVLDIGLHDRHPAKREMAKMLIGGGINVNQQDHRGVTALMYAAFSGDAEMIRLLLKHGAKKELKDHRGRTAADYADAGRHPEIKKILREL